MFRLPRFSAALFSAALLFCTAGMGTAGCTGTDLFAALPAAEQAQLRARAAAVPFASGLIFRATRGAEQITLAGTYHLPDPRHDALMEELAPALASAKALLVEFGPEEEAKLAAAQAEDPSRMFITSGPTIPEILPEADWQSVIKAAEARGIPAVLAAKMKPAYLAMTLGVPVCAMEDLAQGKGGLDKGLMAAAAARGLPVRAVEPWDTVFTLFGRLSGPEEVALLHSALTDATAGGDEAVTTADLYFAREPRLIWEMSRLWERRSGLPEAEVAKEEKVTETLLMTERNKAWVPVVEKAAAAGPVLVAVGALHLSGEAGLLALLARDGYTIERLD